MNATEKQVRLIRELLDEKDLLKDPHFFDSVQAMDAGEYAANVERIKLEVANVSKDRATGIISNLLALPRKVRESDRIQEQRRRHDSAPEPSAGMYRRPNGEILRVYLGQQSGRNLVKRLVDTGQPHPEDPSINLHDWQYVGLAQTKLATDAEQMSLAEAKEYGRMTGSCCRCGRRLDVPESVEAGIGPVCAGKVEEWA